MAKTKRTKARGKTRTQKRGSATAKAASRGRAAARKKAGARRSTTRKSAKAARKSPARKAAARKAPSRKAAKRPTRTRPAAKTRKAAARPAKAAPRARKAPARKPARPAAGGTGLEKTLAQTPETGRTVKGRTNPMPTKRSTGTPAGAGSSRQAPKLDRERKKLRELEETLEGPPSSLDMDRTASAARSGRRHMQDTLEDHNETSPAMTGGDVDADWEDAYAVGDEAPGGDNPTPDQDRVDDIGKALGVTYEDNEELKGADKIAERDKHRWELDPASSDDYRERD